MELSQQVTCLELSKKLKELGVKQESLFWWYSFDELPFRIRYENETPCTNKSRIYSAFTAAELGEMLPCSLQADTASKNNSILEINKNLNNHWLLTYAVNQNLPPSICITDDREADARAKMLIYLIENGLIENENV